MEACLYGMVCILSITTIVIQVDMRIEAINIQRFKRNFQSHSSVVFPTVMDCFVRQSVLIETFEVWFLSIYNVVYIVSYL